MRPIRAIEPAATAAILALNAAHEVETSALDAAKLEAMVADAFLAVEMSGGADAFLIAFDETANYQGAHFRWFAERYPPFVYVDRIVVAAHAQGRGLARALYAELFAAVLESGRALVACEVNVAPPNPVSDAFHAKLGFVEVGRAGQGEKVVRYLTKALA